MDKEDKVDNDHNNDDKLEKDTKVDKDDEVDKDNKVDKDDNEDKNDKVDKEDEEIFFAKILKMTKYNSLPKLVRLGQWEQVSEYYYYYILLPVKIQRDEPSSFTQ